jgi:hypothetical protein
MSDLAEIGEFQSKAASGVEQGAKKQMVASK